VSAPAPNPAMVEAVVRQHCRELKTPALAREHQPVARRAQDGGWSYEAYLLELLDLEVRSRNAHTAQRLLREARFPDLKTLEQLDWDALQGVSRQKVMDLATGQFMEKAENVVIVGPIGTGKTHLAIALGVEAARRRTSVAFIRAADLVRQLTEARDRHELGRLQRRLYKASLLIIDELGFVPFGRDGGELLFNLLADRHERRSTILTTNLAFSEWVSIFSDEKLTTALLDRLAQRVHILTTRGESYRTARRKEKSPRKGPSEET
jgi:DNA replication protein DnaC